MVQNNGKKNMSKTKITKENKIGFIGNRDWIIGGNYNGCREVQPFFSHRGSTRTNNTRPFHSFFRSNDFYIGILAN